VLEFERKTKAEADELAPLRKEGFTALNKQCVPSRRPSCLGRVRS